MIEAFEANLLLSPVVPCAEFHDASSLQSILLYLRHPQSLGIADNRCLIYITKEEKYVPSF